MGVYDSIWVPCPNCQKPYEAQTKSGPCILDVFTLADAPDDVLEDVNRHAPFTCECGCEFKVIGRKTMAVPVINVQGPTLTDAMIEFTRAIEAKSWLSIGLRVEIVTFCADDPPYPTTNVLIQAWIA